MTLWYLVTTTVLMVLVFFAALWTYLTTFNPSLK